MIGRTNCFVMLVIEHEFLSRNTENNVIAWCVGFLNTDCTDYTDNF